jgi:hypothetical protein
VPAHLPRGVKGQFTYLGRDSDPVDIREEWVPFCTEPYTPTTDEELYPSVYMPGPTADNYYFYVDDAAVYESDHKIVPWNGESPDTELKKHDWTDDIELGMPRRTSRARSNTYLTGTRHAGHKYVKRADGLWVQSDPDRASLRLNELPDTLRLDNMADKTLQEWEALEVPK